MADHSDPQALIQVEVSSQGGLSELAAQGVSIYKVLYGQDGQMQVLMPADAGLREQLARLGYKVEVLDAEANGASYYLLDATPEALRRAGPQARILASEGQQSVARLEPEQADELAQAGMRVLPLVQHPLAAPRVEGEPALPSAITPSPLVQAMINQVSSTALYNRVGDLSGEWAVTVDSNPYTILTRYSRTTTPIQKATRFAYEHFVSLGLPSGYDYYYLYGAEKRNVLAQQVGVTQPTRIFLLTAHLDSYSNDAYNYAPGADDNASGSAALMLIADILSQYSFGCTLRYALFTGEEQGLYGSDAYAADVLASGEDLEAVLNLDMLGYNSTGTAATIELHTRPGNSSDLAIANLFDDVVDAYNINLTPQILQDGLGFSDHASFWERGFPALLAIEDWDDHTPYYHTTSDQLDALNMGYYTQFAKAALGTFAHMGCLLDGELSGTVRNAVTSNPIQGASVEARLNSQTAFTAQTQADGTYQIPLLPGDYTVTFSALDYLTSSQGVTVLSNQTTTLNANLQPCVTVKQADFTFSPQWPTVGQTVTFTGTVGIGEPPVSYTWDFGDGGSGSGAVVTHAYSGRGGFPARLTANNACAAPAIVYRPVFVEAEMVFLPLVSNE